MKKKERAFLRRPLQTVASRPSQGLERQLTDAEPALVDVHSKGSDEAWLKIVPQRPGIAGRPEVPAHQSAVHSGVGQHRLRPGVEVMHVHHTAVLLLV